ncbi:MAG: hypothetical protein RR623_03980 [Bacilli bacterium]
MAFYYGIKPLEFNEMTLKQVGEFCNSQKEKIKDNEKSFIIILNSFAQDIESFYAHMNNEKNEHIPISKMFKDVFKIEQKELNEEDRIQEWINVLLK